jgi:hypothetical protein
MSYAQTNLSTNIGDMIYIENDTDVNLANDDGVSTDTNFLTSTLVPGIYSIRGNYDIQNENAIVADIYKCDFAITNDASSEINLHQMGLVLNQNEGWQFSLNAIFRVEAGYGNPVQFSAQVIFQGDTESTALVTRIGYSFQIVRLA